MGKENDTQLINLWYDRLISATSCLNLRKRYAELVKLHEETLDFYIPTLESIDKEMALKQSSDGRPVAIVVAHIMAWEEWQIQVFKDPKRKNRLAEQINLRRYYDVNSDKFLDFASVDDFNAYQAEKYRQWSWKDIQSQAIDIAVRLKGLFPPEPPLGWIEFLEDTPRKTWKILPNKTIFLPAGWFLWMVSLKHEAVEHREDLVK